MHYIYVCQKSNPKAIKQRMVPSMPSSKENLEHHHEGEEEEEVEEEEEDEEEGSEEYDEEEDMDI